MKINSIYTVFKPLNRENLSWPETQAIVEIFGGVEKPYSDGHTVTVFEYNKHSFTMTTRKSGETKLAMHNSERINSFEPLIEAAKDIINTSKYVASRKYLDIPIYHDEFNIIHSESLQEERALLLLLGVFKKSIKNDIIEDCQE